VKHFNTLYIESVKVAQTRLAARSIYQQIKIHQIVNLSNRQSKNRTITALTAVEFGPIRWNNARSAQVVWSDTALRPLPKQLNCFPFQCLRINSEETRGRYRRGRKEATKRAANIVNDKEQMRMLIWMLLWSASHSDYSMGAGVSLGMLQRSIEGEKGRQPAMIRK
jgi:hypothetical protein